MGELIRACILKQKNENIPANHAPVANGTANEKNNKPSAGDILTLPTICATSVGAVPTIQPSHIPNMTIYTANPAYSEDTNGHNIVDRAMIPRQI